MLYHIKFWGERRIPSKTTPWGPENKNFGETQIIIINNVSLYFISYLGLQVLHVKPSKVITKPVDACGKSVEP